MDFLITGQPRSRTAWLANWLTYGPSFCAHDWIGERGLDVAIRDLGWLDYQFRGIADSGAAFCWQIVLKKFPASKVLRVRRPWPDAAVSHFNYFTQHPLPGLPPLVAENVRLTCQAAERCLDDMTRTWPASQYQEIGFAELNDEKSCRGVWEFLLPGVPFNSERWALLDRMRINIASEKF